MTDHDRPTDTPTADEWLKALIVVTVTAILVVLALVWFTMTFLVADCCVSPTAAP